MSLFKKTYKTEQNNVLEFTVTDNLGELDIVVTLNNGIIHRSMAYYNHIDPPIIDITQQQQPPQTRPSKEIEQAINKFTNYINNYRP